MTPVSALIITYNEEKNIKRCLRKLWWCDEIIIVDNGSTDKTLEICKNYQCKIFSSKHDGREKQKKFGATIAKNDWILNVDAGEILSNGLVDEIRLKMASPQCNGYLISRQFIFLDQVFHYGYDNKKYFLRLFNKQASDFASSHMYNNVPAKKNLEKLSNKILHYGCRSIEQLLTKIDRDSTYSAKDAYLKNKKKTVLNIVGALPVNFLKHYIGYGNFLNGLNGFYWSVFSAYYHFAKYIKLNELYKNKPYELHLTSLKKENLFPYAAAK